jgi:hypothetical protein
MTALTAMLGALAVFTIPNSALEDLAAATVPAEYKLTVLNPQGPVKKVRELAPRLKTLEGKKIALWLSATPDQLFAGKGSELYDALAKMLKEKIPGVSIVSYRDLPMKFAPAKEVVAAIEATRPDAVVAAFGG